MDWDDDFTLSMLSLLHSCGKKEKTKKDDNDKPDKWTNSFHIIMNCGITIKNGAIMNKIIELDDFKRF